MPKKIPVNAPWIIEPNLPVIGKALRETRSSMRLSSRDVASLSGVSASHILRMESGGVDYTLGTYSRVASALGILPGALLSDNPRKSQENLGFEIPSAALSAAISKAIGRKLDLEKGDGKEVDRVRLVLSRVAQFLELMVFSDPIKQGELMDRAVLNRVGGLSTKLPIAWDRIAVLSQPAERFEFLKALHSDTLGKLRALGLVSNDILDLMFLNPAPFDW